MDPTKLQRSGTGHSQPEFPSEDDLRGDIERLRNEAPNSEELVHAILKYISVAWVRHEKMAPYIDEAIAVSERIGYEAGRARALVALAFRKFFTTKYDECLPILAEALPAILDQQDTHEWGRAMLTLSATNQIVGSYDQALEYGFRMLNAPDLKDEALVGWMNYRVADVYRELGDSEQALEYATRCYEGFTDLYARSGYLQHRLGISRARTQLAAALEAIGKLEESLVHNRAALEEYRGANDRLGEARALTDIGRILAKSGDRPEGEKHLKEALALRRELGHRNTLPSSLLALGNLYLNRGDTDAAISVLEEAVSIADDAQLKLRAYQAHEALARAHKQSGNLESALRHFEAFYHLKEEVAGEAMSLKIHNRKVLAEIDRAEREAAIERAKSDELAAKNQELADLLTQLRSTQDRLIQSEKMASLGQLTAGIAHEIRNPLNFVNNFSAMSAELVQELAEMFERLGAGLEDGDAGLLRETIETLVFNTAKIREHGKRADEIVSNMIEHARTGNRVREPVDLNNLVEEYVALSYHARLAGDPEFSAFVFRNYDETMSPTECIPKEIGRVVLNILDNAFDAVRDRNEAGACPQLIVSTTKIGPVVEIRFTDNGPGIPDEIASRIFEPFYTTKPTGSGTGLGLSMSYDIVTKGHGGEFRLFSRPGEGATFVVRLPAE